MIKFIVLPYIEKLEKYNQEGRLFFFTSKISHLNNFLSFYEIFLNELRKYLLIHELLEGNLMTFMKYGKESDSQFLYDSESLKDKMAGLAKETETVSFISSTRGTQKTRSKDYNQLEAIKSKADRDEFVQRKLEAILIFCLVYSTESIFIDEERLTSTRLIKEGIKNYLEENDSIIKHQFGDGVTKLINEA